MKKVFMFLFMLGLLSCQSDIENFRINGVVSNSETNSPMGETELTIICWYYGNSPDQSYSGEETKKITTDKNGKYEVAFQKGAYVEILINKNGFSKVHETQYITSKENKINIKMKKE